MEVENNSAVETVSTETAPESVATEAATETVEAPEPSVEAAPPAYQPNLKFKVLDEEKEFDPFIKDVIKDADTEKKVRELYEKAHGLDSVKNRLQGTREKYESLEATVQKEYMPVINEVQKFVHFRNQGDFDSCFRVLGLKKDDVLKWAVNYAQMTPEQRMAHERAGTASQQAMEAQTVQQQYEQQMIQQAADFKQREFDWVCSRPEVSEAQRAFDAANGPGAFRSQVIRTGQYYFAQGQDVSAEQAVNEVIRLIGWKSQASQVQSQPAVAMPQMPQAAQAPQAQAPKAVIPNIQGKGTSPVKKVISSLDDIKARRRELEASND